MESPRTLVSLAAGLIVVIVLATGMVGQETKSESNDGPAKGTKRAASGKGLSTLKVTPEREAAVLAFVSQHHPELRELLIQLKESQPKEYETAVRELYRASERLAQIHERDDERYAAELLAWKLQSRVQLLAARLKMTDSPELRSELERTLHEQLDAQLEVLRRDRQRLAARLEKLDRQIEVTEARREETIRKHLALLREPKKAASTRGKANPAKGTGGNPREIKSDR